MTQNSRDIYKSSNGDRWTLVRIDERIVVRHRANEPSGGTITDAELLDFLRAGGLAPRNKARCGSSVRLSMAMATKRPGPCPSPVMPVELPPAKGGAVAVSRPSIGYGRSIAFASGFMLVLGILLLAGRWMVIS
ncbi:hypothetical protein N8D56_13070 [Devosia sp. A8/3-2]|nr:hypothetical protein N8D56_13070 [Devosia sp. A8/3-2]